MFFIQKKQIAQKLLFTFRESFWTKIKEDLTLNRSQSDLGELDKGWSATFTRPTIDHVGK